MAEHSTLPPSTFLADLEEALRDPEPMCLALVKTEGAIGPQMDAIEECLSVELRGYDLLSRFADDSYIVVFKTLADSDALDARIQGLFERLCAPHSLDGERVTVRCLFGAAVRLPAEGADALVRRADIALRSAQELGGQVPVLI